MKSAKDLLRNEIIIIQQQEIHHKLRKKTEQVNSDHADICMYIYLFVCVCMYVCVYVFLYVCIYLCMYKYICICAASVDIRRGVW